jgi:hypothetical protein
MNRPSFVSVGREAACADYDTVELQYGGQMAELRLGVLPQVLRDSMSDSESSWLTPGFRDPLGFEIHTGQWGCADEWGRGGAVLPQCTLVGQWIRRSSKYHEATPWAAREEPPPRVLSERDGKGHWAPGVWRSVGRPASRVDHGVFFAHDFLEFVDEGETVCVRRLSLKSRRTMLSGMIDWVAQSLPWVRMASVWDADSAKTLWERNVQRGGWRGLVFKRSDRSWFDAKWGICQ